MSFGIAFSLLDGQGPAGRKANYQMDVGKGPNLTRVTFRHTKATSGG